MRQIQLIAGLWLLIVACNKEVCMDCKHTITTSTPSVAPSTTTGNYYLCNEDLQEMKKRDGRITTTQTSGVTVTQKEKVECR